MAGISRQLEIVPAQLSYLAIYNPSLGPTDETFDQQLVFYNSRVINETKASQRKNGKTSVAEEGNRKDNDSDDNNERLRQIGLAQGLVDFAKTFSNGAPVESVDTEKSRIILYELDTGWWILAAIDLTRLPVITQNKSNKPQQNDSMHIEYSSREVSPPALLTQEIKHAHAIFSLHHGPSLSTLYTKLARERFCSLLERFWSRFARSWNVLLHGNPTANILSGVKLASGGELGFGVGEELWGSGERDVLEDFTRQTEGLVDTVVARFGEPAEPDNEILPWLGAGSYASVSDGVIFGGVNAITRSSLESISLWMRHIYTHGDHAYGVRDNPSRERRRRKRRNISAQIVQQRDRSSSLTAPTLQHNHPADSRSTTEHAIASHDHALDVHPGIPPPIVSAAEASLNAATKQADEATDLERPTTLGIPEQYVKYLTLGISTLVKPKTSQQEQSSTGSAAPPQETEEDDGADDKPKPLSLLLPMPDGAEADAKLSRQQYQENKGHFIIGLKGDLDNIVENDETELTEGSLRDDMDSNRTVVRTVHVHVVRKPTTDEDSDATVNAYSESKPARLRVLIYVHRPFIFCFLFEQRTNSLSYASFYQSIHRSLSPVHKALLSSTQPDKVAQRIDDANNDASTQDVFNLLYDPIRLTVHSSIPNIPDPGSLAAEGILHNSRREHAKSWTRLDALNVHIAILNTLESTRHRKHDLERTIKTNRDWWIVWMRFPASDRSLHQTPSEVEAQNERQTDPKSRIAIIVRKASDRNSTVKASTSSSRAASGMWSTLAMMSGSSSEAQGVERVGELSTRGIGFDARKYVEGLLSLNR